MQKRRSATRPARLLAAAGLALLATIALAAPLRAADTDYKGWFVALDLAQTQPGSLDSHYANNFVVNGTDTVNKRLVMNTDSDMTWRLAVGYGFGKERGSLKVSYWSFDNDQTEIKNGLLGSVYPTVFGYSNSGSQYIGYGNNTTYPITAQATTKVKARATDIDYVRPIAVGEKTTIKWLAGLRVASFEETERFDGVIDYNGAYGAGLQTYSQAKHFKSDAVGPRFGVAAVFGFTKHFSMQGSAAFSFLQADTKGESLAIDNSGATDANSVKDDHLRGEIRDYDLRAVWNYGHLDYYLGYSASEWSGLVTDPLPAADCCTSGSGGSIRDNIAFNSLHGGVVWRFGPTK